MPGPIQTNPVGMGGWASTNVSLAANASASGALIAAAPGLADTGVFFGVRSVGSDASAHVNMSFTGYGALTTDGAFSMAATAIQMWTASLASSAVAVTGISAVVTVPPIYALNFKVSNTNTDSVAQITITAGVFGQQN